MNRKILGYAAGGLAIVLLAAQVVPYRSSDNPPVETELAAPAEVQDLLRRACYDCHSNETVWPWYSHIAPAKWLVRYDVAEGRRHLNFSTWNRYTDRDRADVWEELAEVIGEGEMPPGVYTPLHPRARLNAAERASILAWATRRGSADLPGGD